MKLERLMAITILLLNRKRVQAQELADRMEVSLRTIYRDLESLNLAGIPIVSYTGVEGGYEIMDSFRLDRQMLSLDELIALSTALRGLQSTQAVHHSHMDRLLDKVGALVSQAEQGRLSEREQLIVDFTPWRKSEVERAKYEALQQAIREIKLIQFGYTDNQGEETQRCVEPIGLVLKRYTWYLHGYCLTREDYRTFRLSRIHHLQIRPDTYDRRDVALAKLNERMDAQLQADRHEQTCRLVLEFSGDAKVAAVDHFDEQDIERLPSGSLLVRTTVPRQKWLIGFLLHFKTDVIVREPADLAAEVKKAALEIAAMYSSFK
ncbi:YafY family protein [Paenibacillus terrigena]|uniref:helix-turn-helix transcriptional regulator n=1 Tax=Paenibacillus terrigena TaxID=369333 RepID=UPI0028D7FF6D|nr:YafY family protein [Paenibacillus terrigena]